LAVRNVPRGYELEELLQQWPPDGSYDLIHFPYNFKTRRRLGFCFINFVSHGFAVQFQRKWHARALPGSLAASGTLDVEVAKLQGVATIFELFRGKRPELMTEPDFLPAIYHGTRRLDTRRMLLQLGIIKFSN